MIINSGVKLQASRNLQEAARILSESPISLHLRTLQTIRDISTNPYQKIVLFIPNDIRSLAKIF